LTTRLIYRGRIIWANQRPEKPPVFNDPAKDEPSAVAPIRSGITWFDPEDKLYYRVVSQGRLSGSEGWGEVAFWTNKYLKTTWPRFRELVLEGYFDAAMEENTLIRKYRALDISKSLARLETFSKKAKKPGFAARAL